MNWLRRLKWRVSGPRYQAVIVGDESGERHPMSFVTFYYREAGEAWCEQMNAKDESHLTHFELVEL